MQFDFGEGFGECVKLHDRWSICHDINKLLLTSTLTVH